MRKRVLLHSRTMSISLPPELFDLVDRVADSEGISRSAFFGWLFRKEMKERGIAIPHRLKYYFSRSGDS